MNARPLRLDLLLAALLQKLPDVQGVWLFGSEAKGTAHAGSDLDLGVLGPAAFDPVQVFDLGLELGVLAQRDVDLVDLRSLPIVLRKEVLNSGRLVASVQPNACESFAAESMAMYVAFRDELALANAGAHR